MKKILTILLVFGFMFLLGCSENQTTEKEFYNVSNVKLVSENKETVLGYNNTNKPTIHYGYKETHNDKLYIYFMKPPNPETNGEAILLKKGDADILIDTSDDGKKLVQFLQDKGVDDIELLILTSPIDERKGGAKTLLENLGVEKIIINPINTSYPNVISLANLYNIPIDTADYLQTININGISLKVINPNPSNQMSGLNNNGICLLIKDRNFSMMTTADIAYGAETRLVDEGLAEHVNVLEIPNHGLGQATAQIDLFLTKVNPDYAVVTGSYNDPFNMHYTIHEKLKLKHVDEYTTFTDTKELRTIKIITDGNNISFFYEN